MYFRLLESLIAARFLLLITRNKEGAFSTFAQDIEKARRSIAQWETIDHSGMCILQNSRGPAISFRTYI